MRLKTKFQDEDFELGEVVEANVYYGGNGRVKVTAEAAKGGDHTFYFETLKGMNELFEDYEEPKSGIKDVWFPDVVEGRNNVVISFEIREEAEKAVEKLKAFKRLKDKGFKAFSSEICGDDFVVSFKLTNHVDYSQSIDDFDCIFDFGGEE